MREIDKVGKRGILKKYETNLRTQHLKIMKTYIIGLGKSVKIPNYTGANETKIQYWRHYIVSPTELTEIFHSSPQTF
jgi:hypothetical protein